MAEYAKMDVAFKRSIAWNLAINKVAGKYGLRSREVASATWPLWMRVKAAGGDVEGVGAIEGIAETAAMLEKARRG